MPNLFKLHLRIKRVREQLWFRPTLWSVLAVAIALSASGVNRYVPEGVLPDIERQTLEQLLTIIASSMLSVSTFSLSILVGAFGSASSGGTPRATKLVMANQDAQSAIAAFIAAFIYSVIALTALGLRYYGSTGRFILLICTVGMLVFLLYSLLRWLRTLSSIGRLGHTMDTVRKATEAAWREYAQEPTRGAALASAADVAPGAAGHPMRADRTGFVQYIDVQSLHEVAQQLQGEVVVMVRAGAYVHPASVLLRWHGDAMPDDAQWQALRGAFWVEHERTIEHDPVYGVSVLSEIGQRALSSVNDPGTAIIVASMIASLLIEQAPACTFGDDGQGAPVCLTKVQRAPALTGDKPRANPPEGADGRSLAVRYPRIRMPLLALGEAVAAGFDPLARDASRHIEVLLHLQTLLDALAANAPDALGDAAREQSQRIVAYAEKAALLPQDIERLRAHGH